MRIMAILGGTLGSGDLATAYVEFVPRLLQQGFENIRTPFANHEIVVFLAEEAINAYFEQTPDRIMFIGTFAEKGGGTPAFILAYKILTREMDKRKFLFANIITVPPFNAKENFFVITDTDKMAEWLEL